MKLIAVLFSLLALAAASDKYSTDNDEMDVSALSREQIKNYADCFLDIVPCEPVPAQFKADLAEAIKQTCAKCTPAQMIQMRTFLERLIMWFPNDYITFSKKYDPDTKHLVALQSKLSKL